MFKIGDKVRKIHGMPWEGKITYIEDKKYVIVTREPGSTYTISFDKIEKI